MRLAYLVYSELSFLGAYDIWLLLVFVAARSLNFASL